MSISNIIGTLMVLVVGLTFAIGILWGLIANIYYREWDSVFLFVLIIFLIVGPILAGF